MSGQIDGQLSFFDIFPRSEIEPETVPKVCKYSASSCNKEEKWKVATELMDEVFCPHVCCRLCTNTTCGARCNGAVTYDREKVEKKAAEQKKAAEKFARANGVPLDEVPYRNIPLSTYLALAAQMLRKHYPIKFRKFKNQVSANSFGVIFGAFDRVAAIVELSGDKLTRRAFFCRFPKEDEPGRVYFAGEQEAPIYEFKFKDFAEAIRILDEWDREEKEEE